MAKGNPLLGQARGKVGDIVMYRQGGQQVTRAYNSKPANPQSALQLLQRSLMKTASLGYSMMQEICNHSFQGYKEGTENQGEFIARNIAKMRRQLIDYINSGDEEEIIHCLEANFSGKEDTLPEFRDFVVSEGSLPSLDVSWVVPVTGSVAPPQLRLLESLDSGFTYADLVRALGVQRGDQITFLVLTTDDTAAGDNCKFNSFSYARVILEPANGDMSTQFINDNGEVQSPNERNRGDYLFSLDRHLKFWPAGNPGQNSLPVTLSAAAVIHSRLSGQVWQRSTQSLVLRSDLSTVNGHLAYSHYEDYLADAIASFKVDSPQSTLYLNQAQQAF